jgi:hypothetical protein
MIVQLIGTCFRAFCAILDGAMPRVCVFCGAPADSKEHIWPDWLRRRQDIDEIFPHVTMVQRGTDEPERKEFPKRPYELKARVVCKSCNNGWMSDLEVKAARILGGMLDGCGRALHQEGQQDLAGWALKTAMMFDQSSPAKTRVIAPGYYHALRETRQPPRGVLIWLTSYDDTDTFGMSYMMGFEATAEGQDDPDTRNVSVRMFTFGRIAFKVFATTNPALFDLEYRWSVPNVHQLWPYKSSFTWTPHPAFPTQTLLQFAESIPADLISHAEHVDL